MAALRNPHKGTTLEPIKYLVGLKTTQNWGNKPKLEVYLYRQYISLPFVEDSSYGTYIGTLHPSSAFDFVRDQIRSDATTWISVDGLVANWAWHYPNLMRSAKSSWEEREATWGIEVYDPILRATYGHY